MKIISFLFLSFFFIPTLTQSKKISTQSLQLKKAIKEMPGKGDLLFLKYFPKNKEEFIKICHSPSFDELYDCNQLFFPHIVALINSHPKEIGPILATLTSEIEIDADAPSYLQDVWSKFCIKNTDQFVKSLESLKNSKKEMQAIKYLSEYLHHPNNEKLNLCILALEKKEYSHWAIIAKKFRHDNNSVKD